MESEDFLSKSLTSFTFSDNPLDFFNFFLELTKFPQESLDFPRIYGFIFWEFFELTIFSINLSQTIDSKTGSGHQQQQQFQNSQRCRLHQSSGPYQNAHSSLGCSSSCRSCCFSSASTTAILGTAHQSHLDYTLLTGEGSQFNTRTAVSFTQSWYDYKILIHCETLVEPLPLRE